MRLVSPPPSLSPPLHLLSIYSSPLSLHFFVPSGLDASRRPLQPVLVICALQAPHQARLVTAGTLERHKLKREVIAVYRFLGAVAYRAGQQPEAPTGVTRAHLTRPLYAGETN